MISGCPGAARRLLRNFMELQTFLILNVFLTSEIISHCPRPLAQLALHFHLCRRSVSSIQRLGGRDSLSVYLMFQQSLNPLQQVQSSLFLIADQPPLTEDTAFLQPR